jgi:hypothetical protein
MQQENTSRISKKKKQVIASVLRNLNISVKDISIMLGVHRATIYRYSKYSTPTELQHFATEIKSMFLIKQNLLLAKCLAQLDNLLPQQTDLRSLIMAIKVLSDGINNTDIPIEVVQEPKNTPEQLEKFYERIDSIYECRHEIGRYARDPYVESLIHPEDQEIVPTQPSTVL